MEDFTYLDPVLTAIEQAADGTLRVTVADDRCGLHSEAMCAFPLMFPDQYIVLRDGGGKELGVLRKLQDVPQAARTLLHEQLQRRYFLPRITQIHGIAERFGSSVWDVETDRGRCTITTRQMNEAVLEIEPRRYLITDVEGNRYEVKDVSALDTDSRARFLGKY